MEEGQALPRPGYRLMFLMPGLLIFKQGTFEYASSYALGTPLPGLSMGPFNILIEFKC